MMHNAPSPPIRAPVETSSGGIDSNETKPSTPYLTCTRFEALGGRFWDKYTAQLMAILISTSSPSSSDEPRSSGSAAGLLAKSSRSSCLWTVGEMGCGIFDSSFDLIVVGRGPPNCRGASSPLSSSSSRVLKFGLVG